MNGDGGGDDDDDDDDDDPWVPSFCRDRCQEGSSR
jgi:hypothetical protein